MRNATLSDGRCIRLFTVAELEDHWGHSREYWEWGGPVELRDEEEIRFIETERGWRPERYDAEKQLWYSCDLAEYTDADLP